MEKKLYNFFDRREEEYLEVNDIDEAINVIFKHEQKNINSYVTELSDKEKLCRIIDAGFVVSELPRIETLIHSSSNFDNGIEKLQITFNDGKEPAILDVYIEEIKDEKYIMINFLNQEDKDEETYWRRMYDIYGNEKTVEWCSACEEEVVLDNKLTRQICPSCGEKIIPCNICMHSVDDYSCSNCNI